VAATEIGGYAVVDSAGRELLFGLADACRRSAEAFSRAILDIDDQSWDEPLQTAHKERIDLYEVCIRCLIDAGVTTATIRERLAVPHALMPTDRDGAVQALLASELKLEVAFRMALSDAALADSRIGETLAFYLLKSVVFRRQLIVLAGQAEDTLAAAGRISRTVNGRGPAPMPYLRGVPA
jgi:hypothetical protein